MFKQFSTKLLLLTAMILCGSVTAFSQTGAVTGTITDAGDGLSLHLPHQLDARSSVQQVW